MFPTYKCWLGEVVKKLPSHKVPGVGEICTEIEELSWLTGLRNVTIKDVDTIDTIVPTEWWRGVVVSICR